MSTDSTELTFVRCPSCRSLVPAVSTRCRMCGASLEASAEQEGEDDQNTSSGRVRQRTMSQPKSDLNSTAQQLRGDDADTPAEVANGSSGSAASTPAPESAPEPAAEAEAELEDPLGAYIEEVAPATPQTPVQAAPVEEPPAPAPAAPVASDATQEVTPVVAAQAEQPQAEPDSTPSNSTPQVTIESGARRGGQKRGLSFGADKAAERAAAPAAPAQEARRPVEPEPVEEEPEVLAEDEVLLEPEAEEEVKSTRPERRKKSSKRKRSRAPKEGAGAEGVKVESAQQGRLFGWLVSYASSEGAATELREGKFFVTGSSLKDSDLVIDDESVSTPHAMARVGVKEGLVIQDLMSESGIFVRRFEDDTYHKIDDTVTLEHGDWVRFGDVEFLVSLIAHVGAR